MTTTSPARSNGTFDAFDLGNDLLRAISDAGFREPRPIQAKTIPQALKGRDVLGLAQTGTGKTAAFALPMIERLLESHGKHPRGLILAPTRELAGQIHADIEMLGKHTDIRAVTVFGGVSAVPQTRALRNSPDIIVACPGRLLDLVRSRNAQLDDIEMVVLDEADHMLDMGFLPDIRRILSCLPMKRQNLLFSATMPKEIRALADDILYRPHIVELAHSAPAATVEHALYPVADRSKTALLKHLIHTEDIESAIVFLRTKHRARRLAKDLAAAGHKAIALQGNMSQGQRLRAMKGFRDGTYEILVATEIAARGIDVPQVSHVINFDVPDKPDAYTHRIGRTGRAERNGVAFTFVTHDDFPDIKEIERKLKLEIPRVKLKEFAGNQRRGEGEGELERSDRRRDHHRGPRQAASSRKKRRRGGSRRGSSAGGEESSARKSNGRRRPGAARPGSSTTSDSGGNARRQRSASSGEGSNRAASSESSNNRGAGSSSRRRRGGTGKRSGGRTNGRR